MHLESWIMITVFKLAGQLRWFNLRSSISDARASMGEEFRLAAPVW